MVFTFATLATQRSKRKSSYCCIVRGDTTIVNHPSFFIIFITEGVTHDHSS